MTTRLKITLVKSVIGGMHDQRATVRSLGLHKIGQSVERPDTPVVRGMIHRVQHLVLVEAATETAA